MDYALQKPIKRYNLFIHKLLLAFIVFLVVVYVWQINHQAQNTFAIKDLEDKKKSILDSIQEREIESTAAGSLSAIAQRAVELNLASPKEMTFLEIGLNSVAVDYEGERN
jgi:hypothetical protein